MIVYFDKNGVLKEELDSYGNLPRVGSQYFKIFAYFEGLDLSTDYGAAYLHLQRPDLSDSSYPVLFMVQANLQYDPEKADGSSAYFTANGGPNSDGSYPCYLFDFSSIINTMGSETAEDDHIVTLLDTPGQWLATITLINSDTGAANVVGTISFNVDGEDEFETETELDYNILAHNFGTALATKMNMNSPYYLRTYDGFETAATNGTLPKSMFGIANTVVFDKTTQTFYKIESTTEEEDGYCSATYSKIIGLDDKLNISDGITVVSNINSIDLSLYATGQLFYSRNDGTYYKKNSSSEPEKVEGVGLLGSRNALIRYVISSEDADITIGEIPFLTSNLERNVIVNYQSHDYIVQISHLNENYCDVIAFDIFGQRFYKALNMNVNSDKISDLIVPENTINNVIRQYNPNTLYGVDSGGHQVNFSIDEILDGYIQYYQVPDYQTTVSVISDILVNINGRELTNFDYREVTVGSYPAFKIVTAVGGENLTKAKARVYLKAMTGSEFLPEYNYENPSNVFLVLPDGTILKPQWDNNNGLLLYKMKRFVDIDYVDNNILVLSSSSGTLNNEQYAYTLKRNARIFYSTTGIYYEKYSENSTRILFKALNAEINNSQGVLTLSNMNSCAITKATKEFVFGNAGSEQTYGKSKLDADFATKEFVVAAIDENKQNSLQNVDTDEYPTLQSFLASEGEEGYIYLYPIDINDLDKGFYRYIWEYIKVDDEYEWEYLGTTQIDLSDIEVKFEQETFDDGIISVEFASNTDIQLISLVNAVSVDFVIPQDVSQGWISSCTFEIGNTVPTFSISNNSSYNVTFIVNSIQVPSISNISSSFLGNSIVEVLAECNGFDIRIYMKEAQV